MLSAVGVALAVFLAGAVLFARGWLGGGDAKLLSAATLWAGASQTLGLLLVTGVLGGVLALIVWSPFGKFALSARSLFGRPALPKARGRRSRCPMGSRLREPGCIVVVSPHLA